MTKQQGFRAGWPRRHALRAHAQGAWGALVSPSRLVPIVVSILSVGLVLGPALGHGVVLTYDLAWSPDGRLTPFSTGSGTPAPRAVPSDAVAWLLGWLITPALAEKLMLFAVLVLASLGVVALLREVRSKVGMVPAAAAALAAVWNPYVSERLYAGQWTVLLGYALLPWVLRGALRVMSGSGTAWGLLAWLAVAGLGGVNTILIVALGVFPILSVGLRDDARRVSPVMGLSLVTTAGVAAVWALPALAAGVVTDAAGVNAFAPTADTPLGVWGSLLSGGGFWNAATHPSPRDVLLIALLAGLLSAAAIVSLAMEVQGTRHWALVAPVLVGTLVVVLSATPISRGLWTWLVTEVPGGGALRDSQKFLAVWVMATSVGIGAGLDRLRRLRATTGLAPVAALGVSGLVLLLSPQMAWGIGGRLNAEPVPEGYRTGAAQLSSLPAGEVGLLPWSQYRRYDWNGDRVSLTLAPRIIDQRVLFNDSLPLRSGVVHGESMQASKVSAAITRGTSQLAALSGQGVRYVAAELGAGLDVDQAAVRRAGRVVVDDPRLLVVELPRRDGELAGQGGMTRWGLAGWVLSLMTCVVVIAGAAVSWTRRKLPVGLLRSPP